MPFKCMQCGCVADTLTRPVSCRICGGKMLDAEEYLQYAGSKTAVAFTLGAHGCGGVDSPLPTLQPIADDQWLDDVSETKAWDMDEEDALVDREAFVHNLGVLLTQTREDVVKCELIDKGDTVVITFKGGGTRTVNVHADSYAAIIRDVMKQV